MAGSDRTGSPVKAIACVAIAALFLVSVAAGQVSAENKEAKQSQSRAQSNQELNQAKQKAKKYSQKLRKIQKAAMENNPELEKKRDELQEMQRKKMDELVSENATRKEKLQAIMRLRQDQELMEKRKSVQKDFLKAMKEEDPKTQKYLDKLSEARQTMRDISRKRAMEKRKGQANQTEE